ncbi:molecular chaperone DnaK [bacterium]|nr:MAG: molecular chaperone DnaK [bacterium]
MGKVIGIDLGTTNSVVAILDGSQPEIVANATGARTTPSVVSLGAGDEWLVGEVAKRQLASKPELTLYSIKRLMGMRYDEVLDEVATRTYKIVKGENDMACVDVDGEILTPVEISAMLLREIRNRVEEVLGEEVPDAVITVPAYFNDAQRQATQDAGRVAGLDTLRIINEPTAAALAFGLDKGDERNNIAVFDLGGGTFDISILHLGDGVFEVNATGGDTHLGGDDFDQVIIDWVVEQFNEQTGVDLSEDRSVGGRLKEAAEKAKIELSSSLETNIQLPFVATKNGEPLHMDLTLSRARFERMVQGLVDRTLECCLTALEDSDLTPLQVDEVILVGGSTRVPLVQRAVEELFAKMPNKSVHPDEVVALGAAIQAGALDGLVEEVLLLDVTPLSIGLETLGGVVTRIVDRNTTVPTRRSQIFSTVQNNQSSVTVHVVQGEREMAADNRSLARFELSGIPPAKQGVPQVEVTFDIDVDGILHVSARDLGTGVAQKVTVRGSSNLSEDEVERMIKEAAERQDEDRVRRTRAELRHRAETLLLDVESSIETAGRGSISKPALEQINSQCDAVRTALEARDLSALDEAVEKLESASHAFARDLYQGSDS